MLPLGCEAVVNAANALCRIQRNLQVLRPQRDPAGASSLATKGRSVVLLVLQDFLEEVLRAFGAGADVAEEFLFRAVFDDCLLYTSDAADE